MYSNIEIVLHETSHPGNIGSVMRAMETMDLTRLKLVAPRYYPHADIDAMASNAIRVKEDVQVYDSLSTALAESEIVIGTSARDRSVNLPKMSAQECGKFCVQNSDKKIAIVFGPERTGLSNEHLTSCNYHLYIPTSDSYRSLNLAMAVQIICYEIYQSQYLSKTINSNSAVKLATYEQRNNMYVHLMEVLTSVNFFHNDDSKKLSLKIKKIFNKANLEATEVQIIRGILDAFAKSRDAL